MENLLRLSIVLLPVLLALGWVVFNMWGPATGQINRFLNRDS